MSEEQLNFDFFAELSEPVPEPAPVKKNVDGADEISAEPAALSEAAAKAEPSPETERGVTPFVLRQAVLGYLAGQQPTAVGIRVPTRVKKFQVSMAACWIAPQSKQNHIEKVVAIDIFDRREHCLPDCAEREELLATLKTLKLEKLKLEKVIRENEPELKDSDDLFEEFQSYDYSASRNTAYHKLLKQISRLQHVIYKGSRMELIRQAAVADYLYLAVPAGELAPEELADGWGLLHVFPDRQVKVVKVASRQQCNEEGRRHLALNIAATSLKSVLFANGVAVDEHLRVSFQPPPRRRRKRL